MSSSFSITAWEERLEMSILYIGIYLDLYFMFNAKKSSKSPSVWQQLEHYESATPIIIKSFFFFTLSHVARSRISYPSLTKSVGKSWRHPRGVCPSANPRSVIKRYRPFGNAIVINNYYDKAINDYIKLKGHFRAHRWLKICSRTCQARMTAGASCRISQRKWNPLLVHDSHSRIVTLEGSA